MRSGGRWFPWKGSCRIPMVRGAGWVSKTVPSLVRARTGLGQHPALGATSAIGWRSRWALGRGTRGRPLHAGRWSRSSAVGVGLIVGG